MFLAVPLCIFALLSAAPAVEARNSVRHPTKPTAPTLSPEAQALSDADKKLAALARQADPANVPVPAAAQQAAAPSQGASVAPILAVNLNGAEPPAATAPVKVPGSKPAVTGKKKRFGKATRTGAKGARAKAEAKKKAHNVVDRRLTRAEVMNILSTTRDFTGSDLSGLNLAGVDFSGAKFNRANLKQSNLERADLTESDLELADLTGANLRYASLNQARLRGTRLEDTRMEGALWVDKMLCKKGSIGNCIE